MLSLTLARLYEMTQDMRVFVWLCVGVERERCVVCVVCLCGVDITAFKNYGVPDNMAGWRV